jgi:hypothetical protein
MQKISDGERSVSQEDLPEENTLTVAIEGPLPPSNNLKDKQGRPFG